MDTVDRHVSASGGPRHSQRATRTINLARSSVDDRMAPWESRCQRRKTRLDSTTSRSPPPLGACAVADDGKVRVGLEMGSFLLLFTMDR